MRLLCISDIHGHKRALDAVIEYADGLGWDQLVVCGDLCFPGPDPLGVWKLLTEKKALCVQGVSDRALARINPNKLTATTEHEHERIERLRQVRAELGEVIVARLGKLQTLAHLPTLDESSIAIVHGSPRDPTEPFSFEMTDDEMMVLLGGDRSDVIVCGGSHVAFERQLDEIRIVNVGSVGEPASTGYANGTILEVTQLGIQVTQFDVEL